MRFSTPSREEDVYVNVVPFIDVLLVLLIFFLVTTTFMEQSELALTLPEASQKRKGQETNTVRIAIDRSGRVEVANRVLVNAELETIKAAISDAARDMTNPAIVIAADALATHQSVVTAMDAVRQLGYARLSIATAVEEEQP